MKDSSKGKGSDSSSRSRSRLPSRAGRVGVSGAGVVFAASFALTLGGCARSCKNDHPYVPPAASATSSAASASASSVASATVVARDGGGVVGALEAPPNATTWSTAGITLTAPEGREIALAIVDDFDGDGQKDALAVVRPIAADRKPGAMTGELMWFHGEGGGKTSPPGSIAQGPMLGVHPSCGATARLERISPRAAFAEIGSSCARSASNRTEVVVRLGGGAPSIAFDATVVDPAVSPKMTLDVDAADRDKDGNDDIVLRVTLDGPTAPFEAGPRVSASLAFFDRPAGPGRDPEEPEASLKALAAQAAARAGKAKEAGGVPALVQQIRAVYRAICAEGGASRITSIHGAGPVTCGSSKPLEDAGAAEVRAFVTTNDALRAYAAAETAQAVPATRTVAKTNEIHSLLAQAAPKTSAKSARVFNVAVDAPRNTTPEWGPLAFESGGKLLVRHGARVSRVDLDSGAEDEADIGAWPSQVVSPDGKSRWIEAYHACEGALLRASFAPTGDGDMTEVLLPVAPRIGKACAGGRGEPANVVPLAWGPKGLEALVAGHPLLIHADKSTAVPLLGFLEEAPPLGSPRSPGGKALAVPTARGVLVRVAGRGDDGKKDRWMLYVATELEPYADLRHCTVTDDGTKLACVKGTRVAAGTFY